MRKLSQLVVAVLLLTAPLLAQGNRLWVLRSTGEMVEYDPATFAVKQTVKIPADAAQSPANVSVNRLGQMLFADAVALPLSKEDAAASHSVWFWNGHNAATIDLGVKREVISAGSNEAVTETAPAAYLSAAHTLLFHSSRSRPY